MEARAPFRLKHHKQAMLDKDSIRVESLSKSNFLKPSTKLEQLEDSLNMANFESMKLRSSSLSSTGLINLINYPIISQINQNNPKLINSNNNNNNNPQTVPHFFDEDINTKSIQSLRRSISEKLRNSIKSKTNSMNLQNTILLNISTASPIINNSVKMIEPRKWHSERCKRNVILAEKLQLNHSNTCSRFSIKQQRAQTPLNQQQKALLAKYTTEIIMSDVKTVANTNGMKTKTVTTSKPKSNQSQLKRFLLSKSPPPLPPHQSPDATNCATLLSGAKSSKIPPISRFDRINKRFSKLNIKNKKLETPNSTSFVGANANATIGGFGVDYENNPEIEEDTESDSDVENDCLNFDQKGLPVSHSERFKPRIDSSESSSSESDFEGKREGLLGLKKRAEFDSEFSEDDNESNEELKKIGKKLRSRIG